MRKFHHKTIFANFTNACHWQKFFPWIFLYSETFDTLNFSTCRNFARVASLNLINCFNWYSKSLSSWSSAYHLDVAIVIIISKLYLRTCSIMWGHLSTKLSPSAITEANAGCCYSCAATSYGQTNQEARGIYQAWWEDEDQDRKVFKRERDQYGSEVLLSEVALHHKCTHAPAHNTYLGRQ